MASLQIHFLDKRLTGSGIDIVGPFELDGTSTTAARLLSLSNTSVDTMFFTSAHTMVKERFQDTGRSEEITVSGSFQ